MKKIAIITGASSGMGKRFAETVHTEIPEIEEIWVIARRKDRLEALAAASEVPMKPIELDLTCRDSYPVLEEMLREQAPDVRLLVNASGYGFFAGTMDMPLEKNLNMMDLDCGAVMAMCQMAVPHMSRGARILNIASVAAYQPIPYINVYAACKAFCLYYSRALNRELKKQGISVSALCPFWTKTEFFNRAIPEEETPVVKKYVAMYETEDIVKRGWQGLKKGKDVIQYGFIARFQTLLTKLLPHSFVMNVWMNQQKLN